MVWEIIIEALRTSILVSGLVVVMMMLIESMNITSHGDFFSGLRRSRAGQILVSAALGAVPGCMGGFASVSLYTHGIISFGALIAMMIASSGDEAFVMFAMMPDKAWWITLLLLGIAIVIGFLVDAVYHPKHPQAVCCEPSYALHEEDAGHRHGAEGAGGVPGHSGHNGHGHAKGSRHFSWRRLLMFLGVAAFIAALLTGLLEEEEAEAAGLAEASSPASAGSRLGGINLLSEEWMYWLFGALSIIVLAVLIFGEDHFVEEHLWRHVVAKHLPSCFAWTFGVLILLGFGLHYLNIENWISSNTALMIILAALVGCIPESGPHLIFVTLYASGVIPLPVLLASCISQDGHASLPLLAESKTSFLKAKLINFAAAILIGFISLIF
ncbi:MAG: putative manganese transporter [Bacteroidia bacterium]|nr:putative manganese transporter [Bacteroidia bacterium]